VWTIGLNLQATTHFPSSRFRSSRLLRCVSGFLIPRRFERTYVLQFQGLRKPKRV
jgi:hypothetical protein